MKKIIKSNKLSANFYRCNDVVKIAQELLGKVICSNIGGLYSSAIITETESYAGICDRASHAFGGRYTKRTKVMYEAGGVAYIYLCYGLHHLFNIVTGDEGNPHAVLLRGVTALEGKEIMMQRRKAISIDKLFISGPGTTAQALGFSVKYNQTDLTKNLIWIEDRGIIVSKKEIIIGPRIGVDYAGEDAKLPYRFLWKLANIKNNQLTKNSNIAWRTATPAST